uniref:Replicase n=1 Tax=Rabai virus TaxID=2970909 RepID=A0AA48P7E1_9VIRU|nr:TPA_asm: replicase [Rabai virus]
MADILASIGATDAFSFKNYTTKQILGGHNTILGSIVDREVETVAATIATNRANKPLIILPQALDIDQRNSLTSAFPAYNLQFDNDTVNVHGVAAAVTKLSYRLHLDSIGYHRHTAIENKGYDSDNRKYDDYVCIIGGDPAKQVVERNVGVHCCNPLLSLKDSARKTERDERVRRLVDSAANKKDYESVERCRLADKYFNSDSVTCSRLAQECYRTARYAVAVHSTYDISLAQLGDIMQKKKCRMLRGNMMFDSAILYSNSGCIPGINAHYRKDDKTIVFTFEDDNSLNYRHDYATYISYFTTNHFYSTDMKNLFQIEMLENRLGVQYFKVVMIAHTPPCIDVMSHSVWYSAMRGKTVLTIITPRLDHVAQGRSKWWWRWGLFNKQRRQLIDCTTPKNSDSYDGVFEVRYALVETPLVERLRSFAYASTEVKFKDKEIFAYLKSVMSEVYFGNEIVRRKVPIAHDVMVNLAMAVYVEIYAQKYDMGKVMQQLIMDINSDRSLSTKSLLGKLFHSRPSAFDSEIWPLLGAGYAHQFLWWWKKSPEQYKKLLVPADEFSVHVQSPQSLISVIELKMVRAMGCIKKKVYDATGVEGVLKFDYETPRKFSYCPVAYAVLGDEYCNLIASNLKRNFQIQTSTDEVRDVLNLRVDLRAGCKPVLTGGKLHADTTTLRLTRARQYYEDSTNHDALKVKAMETLLTSAVQSGRWSLALSGLRSPSDVVLALRFVHQEALSIVPRVQPLVTLQTLGCDELDMTAVSKLVTRSYDRSVLYSLVLVDYNCELDNVVDPKCALYAVENLTAVGGNAVVCVPLCDVIRPEVFVIVVRIARYFKDFTIFRDAQWYMASEVLYLQFKERIVPIGDYVNTDMADYDMTYLKVGGIVKGCVERLISDLYRAADGYAVPTVDDTTVHPYFKPTAPADTPDPPETPPPTYQESGKQDMVALCASVRDLPVADTDEYRDCSYRQKLKLHSLLVDLPIMEVSHVLELGSAPGTWSLLLCSKYSGTATTIHLVSHADGLRYPESTLQKLRTYANVVTLEQDVLTYLSTVSSIPDRSLVVCDVASANSWTDDFLHVRIASLIATSVRMESQLVMKIPNVHSDNVDVILQQLSKAYSCVYLTKPLGSRARSTEVYCIAHNGSPKNTIEPVAAVRSRCEEAMRTLVLNKKVNAVEVPTLDVVENYFRPALASVKSTVANVQESVVPSEQPTVPTGKRETTATTTAKDNTEVPIEFAHLDTMTCTILSTVPDGQCCYNALTQGNCRNLKELKSKLLDAAKVYMSRDDFAAYKAKIDKDEWGDIDDLQAFASAFAVQVVVYDYHNMQLRKFGTGNPVRVRYSDNHYDAILCCPYNQVGVRDHTLPPSLFPVNVFKTWFNDTLLTDSAQSVVGNKFAAKVLGTIMGVFSSGYTYLDEVARHIVVMQQVCDMHAKCNFDHFVEACARVPTDETLTMVVFNDQRYLSLLSTFVANNGLSLEGIYHPMIFTSGYLAFKVNRVISEDNPPVSPTLSASYQFNHVTQCKHCESVNTWAVGPLYYQTITQTYSTCKHSLATIIPTSNPPKSVKTYSFRSIDGCNSDIDIENDNVIIAVRFLSVTKIDPKTMRVKLPVFKKYLREHQPFAEYLVIDIRGTTNSEEYVTAIQPYCTTLYVRSYTTPGTKDEHRFQPQAVVPITLTNKRKNAMYECAEMMRYEKYRVACETAKYAEQHRPYLPPWTRYNMPRVTLSSSKVAIIDFTTGRYMLSNVDFDIGTPFVCGYSYEKRAMIDLFMLFAPDGKPIPTPNIGYVAVTKDCKIFNSDTMYAAISKRTGDMDKIGDVHICYIDGAPGVGKTRYILQNHDTSDDSLRCVVLSVSRQSAESFRSKAMAMFPMSEKVARLRYRTLDSFIINYTEEVYPHVTELWIDEGVMEHPGKLLWAALLCGAEKLFVVGDKAQIPFIDRDQSRSLTHHDILSIKPDEQRRTTSDPYYTSYRVPQDIAACLNYHRFYPLSIRTANSTLTSINLHSVQGSYNFRTRTWEGRHVAPLIDMENNIDSDTVVLVYKQDDKAVVKSALARKNMRNAVHTIHEFQGSEAKKIILIRLSPKPNPVYDQRPQIVVGITRHTHQFLYITTDQSDLMCKTLLGTWYDINAIKKTLVDKLSGGGVLAGARQNKQFPEYDVEYSYEKTYDMLKQNKVLRDLVVANRGHNIIPVRPCLRPLEVPSYTEHFVPTQLVANPLTILQEFIDAMIPGGSTRIMRFDSRRIEEEHMHVTSSCSVRDTYRSMGANKPDSMSSSLRTCCPTAVNDTLRQFLKAYGERNGGVPDYGGVRDDWVMSSDMVDTFCDAYLVERDALSIYENREIDINVDSIEDWLAGKPQTVLRLIETDEDYSIFDKNLSVYNMMLKRLPKIVTDAEAAVKNKSPQTILYQCQKVNAIFSPVVREMKARLIAALRKDKVIATDMSIDELEELMSYRFPPSIMTQYARSLEGDIGKFDKSQELLALYFELKMMLKLGFPQKYVALWTYMHVYTRMLARHVGFSAFVHYQRKSGDAMTFLGNTMFLMAVVAMTYGVNVVRHSICWFAGDDYYIISKSDVDLSDAVLKFAMSFNLEMKVMTKRTPYFCSKFFVPTSTNKWKIIPDLVKTVVKLGRHDLVNSSHAAEFRQSLKDLYRDFINFSYVPYLSSCLADRYKPYGAELIYRAIYTVIFDDDQWKNLYYVADNDIIDEKRGFSLKDF